MTQKANMPSFLKLIETLDNNNVPIYIQDVIKQMPHHKHSLLKPKDTLTLNKPGTIYLISRGSCHLACDLTKPISNVSHYRILKLIPGQSINGLNDNHINLSLSYANNDCEVMELNISACHKVLQQTTPNKTTATGKVPPPKTTKPDWQKAFLFSLLKSLQLITTSQNLYCQARKSAHASIIEKQGGILRPGKEYFSQKQLSVFSTKQAGISYAGMVKIDPPKGYFPVTHETFIETTAPCTVKIKTVSDIFVAPAALTIIDQAFKNILILYPHFIQTRHDKQAENIDRIKQDNETKQAYAMEELSTFIKYGERTKAAFRSRNDLLYACQIIFDHSGIKHTLPEDKKLGLDINNLDTIATESSFRYRRVTLVGSWWQKNHGPLLAYKHNDKDPKTTQPVALIPIKGQYYLFERKHLGQGIKITPEIAQTISTECCYLYPAFDPGPLTIKSILTFGLRAIKNDLYFLVAFSFIGGILSLIMPIMSMYVINIAIPDNNVRLLFQIVAFLITITLTSTMVSFVVEFAKVRITAKLSKFIEPAFVDRIIRWPSSNLNRFTSAMLNSRIKGISQLKSTLTVIICTGIPTLFFLAYALGISFYFFPIAGAILLFILLLLIGIVILLGMMRFKAILSGAKMSASVSNIIYQSIQNIRLIRTMGLEQTTFNRWSKGFSELNNRQNAAKKVANVYHSIIASFRMFVTGLCFLGIAYINQGDVNLGVFIAFISSLNLFFMFSLQLVQTINSALDLLPSIKFSKSLLTLTPEHNISQISARKVRGNIAVSQLFYQYIGADKSLLKNINLEISKGDFVAIVGISGSGKSTLLKILFGLYQIRSGAVTYDGFDVKKFEPAALRKQFGVLLQTSKLFPGTISDNVIAMRDYSTVDVWKTLALCKMDHEIKKLPMQLYTMVNEDTSTLSHGQIQRLLLARELISNPSILFLDEPTSNMDEYHTREVFNMLYGFRQTRIVITHRLNQLKRANNIVVMRDGQVAESGTYDELVNNPQSLFKAMLEMK